MSGNPDAVIAATPADHLISKEEEFRKVMNEAFKFTTENNALLTLGIKPDRPETGYGYIQANFDQPVKGYPNLNKVKAFSPPPKGEGAGDGKALSPPRDERPNHRARSRVILG